MWDQRVHPVSDLKQKSDHYQQSHIPPKKDYWNQGVDKCCLLYKYHSCLYLCGEKGLNLQISTVDIMGKEVDFSTKDYDDGVISCIAKQVGYDHVPKYGSCAYPIELLTQLNNE